MLPVGIGNGGVVVLSNGRVVGGINVTSPLGSESVMFVVAVTTKIPGFDDDSGTGVIGGTTTVELIIGISILPVPTGTVRVEVEFTTMELDPDLEYEPLRSSLLVLPLKVDEDPLNEAVGVILGAEVIGTLRVMFALGVSMATDELDEGVAKPLDAVTFPVLVLLLRLKTPKRSPEVVVPIKGTETVPLVGAGGMTPDAPVETVTPVSNPVVKLPTPPVEIIPVVGTGSVEFTVSVTTKVPPGGMTPAPPVLFAVAVLIMTVILPPPVAVVMISVTTVGVATLSLPVTFRVAMDVNVVAEVLFEISTTRVSEETVVTTIGVSKPLVPVDVTVITSLDATTIVLVLRGGP